MCKEQLDTDTPTGIDVNSTKKIVKLLEWSAVSVVCSLLFRDNPIANLGSRKISRLSGWKRESPSQVSDGLRNESDTDENKLSDSITVSDS